MSQRNRNIGKYKKRIARILIVCILFFFWSKEGYCSSMNEEELTLYAESAVLMDADSGRVLYEKNAKKFLANASTTKIMTCILALEYAHMDEVVEISPYAVGMPKVKLYVKSGEHYRLEDLLYSLMLESHNDSAVAIAEHIGGKALSLPKAEERSREESKQAVAMFMGMMNEKALEIGCKNTWFLTPNGLDARVEENTECREESKKEGHGTTAEDLARMMAYCASKSPKKEEFLKITQRWDYNFSNQAGNRNFCCVNHNAFLKMMKGAISGKTGFTNKAGYCYVGALEQGQKHFTIALLACGWPNHKSYKWEDAKKLYTYGLENFEYRNLDDIHYDEEKLKPILVNGAQTRELGEEAYLPMKVLTEETSSVHGMLLQKDEKVEIVYQQIPKLRAPIKKGMKVGKIEYRIGKEVYKTEYIISTEEMKKIDYRWCFIQVVRKFIL